MAICAMAGFRSIVIAGGFGLNSENQGMQNRKVSSSVAGVSSARLRPTVTRSSQPARCVHVSAQAPSFGTMKKVSGHHGFNWPICATGAAPEENEPDEEPGDEEPTSDEEILNNNEASHEVTTNGAPCLFEEDKQIIEEFNKRKLQIYEEYITQDDFSDDEPLAEVFNEILAEYYGETVEQKNAMKVVAQLEELYNKTPNAEALVKPDVFDYAFLALLTAIFVVTGVAGYMSVFSEPVAEQLHALLPEIKKEFGVFFYDASKLIGRFND